MKKILAFAVAAVALSGSAFAQNSASSSAAVTGTVQVPITIVNQQGLDFGTALARSTNPNIDPTSGNGAKFLVEGDAGDLVLFTIDANVLVSLETGVDQDLLGVNPVGGQATTMTLTTASTIRHLDDASTSILIVPNPHPLSTPGVNDDGSNAAGDGDMYLYVGGTMPVGADQQRGSYAGTLNVTVAYSN